MNCIIFDIGGTKTRVALSVDGETLLAQEKYDTPHKPQKGVELLITTANQMLEQASVKVEKVVGGIRGRLNEDHQYLEKDDILTAWEGFPLVESFEKAFNVPVILENDTALAGLGEAVFGAGKGFDYVVYHTVSTGVGGVKIEQGKIDQASTGFEPGHQILDIDKTILGDDINPTLENLVSGRAVEERMGTKPYEIDQSDVLWDTLAQYLGQGLRNSILYWSPEVIVLGGSMILGDPKILLDDIRKYTVEALDGFTEAPYITAAKYGDEAGLYGAIAKANEPEE